MFVENLHEAGVGCPVTPGQSARLMWRSRIKGATMIMLFLLILPAGRGTAQHMQDTLREVEIQGKKKQVISNDEKLTIFSPGQKTVTIDSLMLRLYSRQTLAQMLYQQAPVFIRSYGLNGLATLNFRGSSAAQAQVLWNGVPLQNAALGIADLSLLPVATTDRVRLVFGSSAALWGSGNVGGVLLLENERAPYDTAGQVRMQASVGVGSFGQRQAGLKLGYSTRKWQIGVNAFGQQAVNDFSYQDMYGTERRMDHSQLRGGGMMLNASFRPDAKNEIRVSGWHQQYDRQIPAALFEAVSRKEQLDRSTRLLLAWERNTKKTVWYARSAWVRDLTQYSDPLVLLAYENQAFQYFHETGWRRKAGRAGTVSLFMPIQHLRLQQPGSPDRSQTRIALAGAWQRHFFAERLSAAGSVRAERIDRTGILLPGFNASYTLCRWLQLRGNVQRTYRAPTLNEWYYNPGGNDRLLPESGWAEELGYIVRLGHNRLQFTHEAAVFNRDIKDWILWFGGAIWTPHNIAIVNSRGAEVSGKLLWRSGRWLWHANGNTSFIRARTRESHLANDGSTGRQIPYTPMWQWQANAGFTLGNVYFNYNHTYSGYRFVTMDESQLIPAFHTGNIQLMYTLPVKSSSVSITLQCNNIMDQRYEVVAGRPMPGRNWLGGLTIGLHRFTSVARSE
jgi:vitamin B12 transporter